MIGKKVKLYSLLAKTGDSAEIVDMFPSGVIPDADKVRLYYKFKPGETGERSALRAQKNTRIILRRPNGFYIVMPDTPFNARYWELVQ